MKICPNCGSSFDDGMRFCVQCGTVLEEAPAAPEVPEAPAAEEVAAPVAEEVTAAPAAPTAVEAPQPEAAYAASQPEFQQPQPEFQQPPYGAPAPGFVPPYGAPVAPPPAPNPDDHTPEMDPEDIAKNKLYAMLIYLLGPIGIIIALLKDKESAFLNFHIKLSVKYLVVTYILAFATVLLCWTFIVPIAASICLTIISVLEIITFVQVCKGEAKDPAIIKNIKFLN